MKEKLNKEDIAYESEDFFEEKLETMEEYDPDQVMRKVLKRRISPIPMMNGIKKLMT